MSQTENILQALISAEIGAEIPAIGREEIPERLMASLTAEGE
jgi:hypothetical protein